MKDHQTQNEAQRLESRIKAAWGLSQNEAARFSTNEEEFFKKLEAEHGVSRNEAERKIHEIKSSLRKTADAA